MNAAIWALAGGILGWIGYSIMGINGDRGMIVSVIIGVVGGFLGGNVLAPMLGANTSAPNNFDRFSLIVASASAAACLIAGNLLSNHYGI